MCAQMFLFKPTKPPENDSDLDKDKCIWIDHVNIEEKLNAKENLNDFKESCFANNRGERRYDTHLE